MAITEGAGARVAGRSQEVYRGLEYNTDLLQKIKIETVVAHSGAREVLAALAAVARTDKIGDGKFSFSKRPKRFVFATTSAVKLRYNAPPPLN